MYIIIIIIMAIIFAALTVYIGHKKYWEGRKHGWDICEQRAMDSAVKCGYDQYKFWGDVLRQRKGENLDVQEK